MNTTDAMFSNVTENAMVCRCIMACPGGLKNSTCSLYPNGRCFKRLSFNEETGLEEIVAGCLRFAAQCNKQNPYDKRNNRILKCCNNGSMCNDYLDLHFPSSTTADNTKSTIYKHDEIWKYVIIVVAGVFICGFGLMCYKKYFSQNPNEENRKDVDKRRIGDPVLLLDVKEHKGKNKRKTLKELAEEGLAMGTSSGSGLPLLVQRTISKQINMVEVIGCGRYGKVMLGKWREEDVAVKIFNSNQEASWSRETEIYQTVMLRHENILGFIAADISGAVSWTQLYLITEYHKNGSLYNYLQTNILNVTEALILVHSACCGLAHLHTEISGTQGKPAIAHRDVKSKNILVKRDGRCCIADMGLAVRYSRLKHKVDIGSYEKSRRQGTKRYMAPEVLTQTYNFDSFEAYALSDVYSFALVMWEIANRTTINGIVEHYHPPYYDVVGNDPGFEEMLNVVVDQSIRPKILPQWNEHKIMFTYAATMQESWKAQPECRLSILRIRKTLNDLRKENIKFEETISDYPESGTVRKTSASSSTTNTSAYTSESNVSPDNVSKNVNFQIIV